ncbi:efflux transporter outer membrane subunit [Acinetobacter nematophilus]|uniref:Efflux transporter outer membrane subunit n=1 Tax=Acinetobacter nematophilus TaxID=2994642 RepID=A0A9X3DRZ4_9GAMM|nr:efflux transporter outer membrane subunit [Acinetobacter nematophilus]MCX5466891.1 efflux transporter outer membrane subunit [Acinetobacter nematophilus]
MQNVIKKNVMSLSCMLLLTACQSTKVWHPPQYRMPIIQADQHYKYSNLNWKETANLKIQPNAWWEIYQDSTLNQLLQQLNLENLDLKQAEARYLQAAALLDQQYAQGSANLTVNSGVNRQGTKQSSTTNQWSMAIQASWIPDLWGRVAKAIEGQNANLAASQADLDAVKLNQQLLATQAYWNIRILDAQLAVLQQTQKSYSRSVQILNNQYLAGMIARADVIQAETQRKQVDLQRIEMQRDRDLQENILAILQGKAVSQFQLPQQQQTFQTPVLPIQIPSRLLIQRPDVIRAERELAATHAELGLAQTAWLPDISIGINGSVNAQTLSQLFQAPQYLWSTGLQATSMIFDGGKRQAEIDLAQARYAEKTAAYKQTVLNGWKEVEDALLQSASFRQQQNEQSRLFELARENEQVVTRRYQAGLVSYLEVVTAQNLRLQTEQANLTLKQRQLNNTAQLIAALGGQLN